MAAASERKRRRSGVAAELAAEGPTTVTVRGGCMAPLLADGDRVEVRQVRRYLPGDVVAFRGPQGGLLVHRVLGVWRRGGGWCLVTRGDRDDGLDAPVPLTEVVGRWQASVPMGVRLACGARFIVRMLAVVRRRMGG